VQLRRCRSVPSCTGRRQRDAIRIPGRQGADRSNQKGVGGYQMTRIAWLAPLLAAIALAGCGTAEKVDRYKIIAVKAAAKQRIVYRTKTDPRACPPLPKLADGAGKPGDIEFISTVIRMYKECAK